MLFPCSLTAVRWCHTACSNVTSYLRNPRAAEIDRLTVSNKLSDLTPAKPGDKTWCVLLPGSQDCSQQILHQIKVHSGPKKPARDDFSVEMVWPTLCSQSTKPSIPSKDFKVDKRISEERILGAANNLEIWDKACERAPLVFPWITPHRPGIGGVRRRSPSLPGKLTLAPNSICLPFWLSILHGLSQNAVLNPWKPWSICLVRDPHPTVKIQEMNINKSNEANEAQG